MAPRAAKKRRVAGQGASAAGAAGAEAVRWSGELPREIVALIASHTCARPDPLPFTGLAQVADPEAGAYHRFSDRTFSYAGGQFAPDYVQNQGQQEQLGQQQGQGLQAAAAGGDAAGGSAGPPSSAPATPPAATVPQAAAPGAGPAAATAAPAAHGGAGGAASSSSSGGGGGGGALSALPGTFRPMRMSEAALAMRCVCRLWCEVLSEGVRRVLLSDAQPRALWPAHFPRLTHLALGPCTDVGVHPPDGGGGGGSGRRAGGGSRAGGGGGGGGGGSGAGPGPGSAAAAAAAAAAAGTRARRGRAAEGAASAASSSRVRSLAGLTCLRNLQVLDIQSHLDLAATCPHLEELVVCAHGLALGTPAGGGSGGGGGGGTAAAASHFMFNFNLGPGAPADAPLLPMPLSVGSPGGGGGGGRGGGGKRGGGGAATVSRRSALDQTLGALPTLQRLRLTGLDASAARLCSALLELSALTSLRLQSCQLPHFFGARRGCGVGPFGRRLAEGLGARLADLSLQSCGLATLQPEVLGALTGLRMLDLSHNTLGELPHTITTLTALEYLDLQSTMLGGLPDGMSALSRLVDLDLSWNHLAHLPADFGGLTGLTHLHLGGVSNLDLASALPCLLRLTNLHALGLSEIDLSPEVLNGHIQFLGPGAAGLELEGRDFEAEALEGPLGQLAAALGPPGRLRELVLDGCGLERRLPANFSALGALTHLSIMENFDGNGLPEGITSLRNLAVLRLAYLDLQGPLPAGLWELTGLRALDLEQNFLTALPHGVSRLSNLQILNLDSAFDADAPPDAVPWPALYSLRRLRQLLVSGTACRVAPGISALTGLEVLHLRYLTVTPAVLEEVCGSLVGLQVLDVSTAGVARLPNSVSRLSRLTDLQLYSNRLTSLPNVFASLTRLTELGLSDNPLRALPPSMAALPRVRTVSWTLSAATQRPAPEVLAWLAGVPDLVLYGKAPIAEWARAAGVRWPAHSGRYGASLH